MSFACRLCAAVSSERLHCGVRAGGVTMGADGFVEESPCNFNDGMRGIKVSPYEGSLPLASAAAPPPLLVD